MGGRRSALLGGALAMLLLAGCAPALPSFAGGRTVPTDRSDLALGAAVRVPVGELVAQPTPAESDALLSLGAAGGVAPVAFVRHGLGDGVDLGLGAAGSLLQAEARARVRLGMVSFIGAFAPHGGLADSSAGRLGATLPLVLGLDLLSLVEVWLGVRVGVEHVFGELDEAGVARSVSLTGVRTGGLVGFGVGFRRVHVLLELGVDHELWTGSLGDRPVERNGVALTPAFAVRARL